MAEAAGNEMALDGLTMRFVEHLASMRYEDLPSDVVAKAKLISRRNMMCALGCDPPRGRTNRYS